MSVLFDINRHWYGNTSFWIFRPLSRLFGAIVALRRWLYTTGKLKSYKAKVPVIVVGNIIVGGTGKTPFVIWLANYLRALGYEPGIVSRGVGGKQQRKPRRVSTNNTAAQVGDEALLLMKKTSCPIVVGIDRVAAINFLLKQTSCNIIISDDGLQHYRMQRDVEIALIDGVRGLGNKKLLPEGPLREPETRLKSVDFVIVNGGTDACSMTLVYEPLVSMHEKKNKNLADLKNQKVHAVTAIGHPERFFTTLEKAGIILERHTFPDHYLYNPDDFKFGDGLPIVLTEKDAVKCMAFADSRFWYLPVSVKMGADFERDLLKKVHSLEASYEKNRTDAHPVTCPDHTPGHRSSG